MSSDWEETCPLDKGQVTKAVKALKDYISKTEKKNEKGLLEEHNVIQLQILLHKIPALKNKSIFIELPHSLFPKGSEICLITKNSGGDNTEKTVERYATRFKEREIDCITKIMPMRELRLDYGSYEARRRLVGMYDLFLSERAISHRLSGLLGKIFYSAKREPWVVNLKGKTMKEEIDRLTRCTRWHMSGGGSCSLVVAAKTGFSVAEIVENIMACGVEIAKEAPRGWNNVRSIHVRTDNSIALPIYYNDCPIDVDDLDLRELHYLLRRKEVKENKKRLLNLIGWKKTNWDRRMDIHMRSKAEKRFADSEAAMNVGKRQRMK